MFDKLYNNYNYMMSIGYINGVFHSKSEETTGNRDYIIIHPKIYISIYNMIWKFANGLWINELIKSVVTIKVSPVLGMNNIKIGRHFIHKIDRQVKHFIMSKMSLISIRRLLSKLENWQRRERIEYVEILYTWHRGCRQ